MNKMLENKVYFIEHINEAFDLFEDCEIEKIELQLFDCKTYIQEFLKVTFKGGAYCIRNANGNSNRENLRELSNIIYGGYYDEVEYYNTIAQKYKQIKVGE